jgi:hypothetical protein
MRGGGRVSALRSMRSTGCNPDRCQRLKGGIAEPAARVARAVHTRGAPGGRALPPERMPDIPLCYTPLHLAAEIYSPGMGWGCLGLG